MYISELRIHNVKRLHAVGIAPDSGEPIILTGDNAQGKSSVLDAIFLALKNKGLEDPIRHGTSKATVKLKLSDGAEKAYTVTRTVTKKTNSVTVVAQDGSAVPSPQAFLDGLVGSLAFDPLEFVRMKPKAQAEALRVLVGLDTRELDKRHATIYATRTEVNRALDQAKAQVAGMVCPPEPEEVTEPELSALDLIKKRDEATEKLRLASDTHARVTRMDTEMDAKQRRIKMLNDEVDALVKDLHTQNVQREELAKTALKLKQDAESGPQLADLTKQISNVETINANIRTRKNAVAITKDTIRVYTERQVAVDNAKKRSEELTQQLEDIVAKKDEMARKVEMPVKGMTYDDDGVFIDSVRFDQMSTAEQVRISAAIAMRSNPTLRLILVREGALLNKTNLKAIIDAAKEGDYQIFLEKFQEEPGSEGLHIVDGSITHIDGKPVAEAPESDADQSPMPEDLKLA